MSLEFHGASDRNLDRDIEDFFQEEPPQCERCAGDLRTYGEIDRHICDLCLTFLRLESRET